MMVTMINNYHNDDDGFFILIDRSSQSINDHNYMMVTMTTTTMTMTASTSLSTEFQELQRPPHDGDDNNYHNDYDGFYIFVDGNSKGINDHHYNDNDNM